MPLVEWPSLRAVDKSAGIVRFDISEGVDSVTVTAEVPGMEENDFFWDRLLGTFRPIGGEDEPERVAALQLPTNRSASPN